MGDSSNGSRPRNGWVPIASVAAVVAVGAVSGAWAVSTAVNAAIGALDHRLTVVESKETNLAVAATSLADEVKQLREVEGNLTLAVDRLNNSQKRSR